MEAGLGESWRTPLPLSSPLGDGSHQRSQGQGDMLGDCCGDSLLSQLRQISAGCILSLGWEDETLCVCVCLHGGSPVCIPQALGYPQGLFVGDVSFSVLLDDEMLSVWMLELKTLCGQVLSHERALPTQLLSLPLGTPLPSLPQHKVTSVLNERPAHMFRFPLE